LWKDNAAKNGYTVVVDEQYALGNLDFTAMILKPRRLVQRHYSRCQSTSGEALSSRWSKMAGRQVQFDHRAPENVTGENLGKNAITSRSSRAGTMG